AGTARELAARVAAESAAANDRERAGQLLAEAESAAHMAADRAGAASAAAGALNARLDEARRALEAAEGGAFSRAARARGVRRIVWLPDPAACLELQPALPPGWLAVARDGSLVVGEVVIWLRPDGRGLNLQADVDRLTADAAAVTSVASSAAQAHATAVAAE